MTTFTFTRKLISTATIAGIALGIMGALDAHDTASADSYRTASEGTVGVKWGPGELHEYTIQKSNRSIQEISGLKMEVDVVE